MTKAKLSALTCLLILSAACSQEETAPADPADSSSPPQEAMPTPDYGHSSRNSLDWAGTYSGVTPCADCPGIRTTVTLHADGRFERTLVYLERSPEPHTESGEFEWNAAGSNVTLHDAGGGNQQYKVGENTLTQLDQDGNPITGELAGSYVLQMHLRDPEIEGRRWTLTELRGAPVATDSSGRGAFLLLDADKAVASGNSSCNSFSGAYAIKSGNRISFNENMAVTMMACPDMSTEEQFLDVLRNADNYAVADGVLSLNRARMAPLARFEVAEE